MRRHSIVHADGSEREVDTIIFGTGFHVTDIPIAVDDPRPRRSHAAEVWQGPPEAYKGTTVAGYPNLFFLVGPNTGLGHNSIVFMIESQIEYLVDALRTMRRRGARTLEVRPEAQAAWGARLERMTEGTVWVSGGCQSCYIDRNGHNPHAVAHLHLALPASPAGVRRGGLHAHRRPHARAAAAAA